MPPAATVRIASTISVDLGALVEVAGRAAVDRRPDDRGVAEARQQQDRGALRSPASDLEEPEPLGSTIELHVADEDVAASEQIHGVGEGAAGPGEDEVVGGRNGIGDRGDDRGVVVDDADADGFAHRL